MAEADLQKTLQQLRQTLSSSQIHNASSLLSRAKLSLLKLNALVPNPQASRNSLLLARETLELGALISIRLKDSEAFTRYFQQLQPFYSLPTDQVARSENQSKITGLFLLLRLSQGDYAGFHTVMEGLEVAAGREEGGMQRMEADVCIQYPVRLEQALMEGSYDRVWGETKGEKVPSEEFAIFTKVRSRPTEPYPPTRSLHC